MVTVAGIIAEFLRIVLTFTRPFSDKVLSFFYNLVMGPTKPLPPIKNPLLLYSATELAEMIRKRKVKCEDVMKAYVGRSREVHPIINAACGERYEDALNDARAVDRFLDRGEKTVDEIARDTPLLGVPFTCKEAIGVKDMAQTCGIYEEKHHVAEQDSEAAAQYRKAGAIPVTVTSVPETCMWWESANHIFGMPKNPYNHTRTVGGSSGGEGAIITSCGALMGIGNDIAGSIRIPSSFCGIYGHKPTTSVISNKGSFPCDPIEDAKVDAFVSTGPMCRYVKDLPVLLQVLSNYDKRITPHKKVNLSNVKVYYMEEIPGILNSTVPAIKEQIRRAAKHFEVEFGIKCIPLKLEALHYAFPIWECKLLEANVIPFKYYLSGGKPISMWWEFIKSLFRMSQHTWPAIYFAMVDRRSKDHFYHKCLKKYQEIESKFREIFQEDAVLLIPTHPEPPPHYLMTIPKYPNIAYTCIFNILGFPSSQIPTGLTGGLPIGIQAISGRFKDHLTLSVAQELDKVFGGWKSPCAVEVGNGISNKLKEKNP